MLSQSRDEVEHDCWKTYRKIKAFFEGNIEPDSDTWHSVSRLSERLQEEAGRAYALAMQMETLAKLKADEINRGKLLTDKINRSRLSAAAARRRGV